MSLFDVFKSKRKPAIQSLGLDSLLEIAKNETEEINRRKSAIQRISITSPQHLDRLLETVQDASLKNEVKEAQKRYFFKTVKNHIGNPNAQIRKMLDELQVKDKEKLLLVAKSAEIRMELLSDCAKQGLLAQVAKSDAQEEIALAALAKVERENLLEEIKNDAVCNAARAKAKEMLSAAQAAKTDPAKEQADLLVQKQKALLSHAARLLENKNPFAVDAEMQRLCQEASKLGSPQNAELNSIFEKHKENVLAEKTRIAEEQAKAREQAQAKAQAQTQVHEPEQPETQTQDLAPEGAEEKAAEIKEDKLSEEEYNAKLTLLQAIIDRVNALDENGNFNEISQHVRQAFFEWKEIVGEKKTQFKNIYKEFRTATGRFQNLQEWASWHAEQIREQLIKDIEDLANMPIVLENRTKAFAMLEQWKAAGYMPATKIQELWPRFKTGLDKVMDSVLPLLKEQEKGQEENLKTKEDICAQIEVLAATEGEWGEQLRKVQELQAKWKNAGFVPKTQNQAIWDRYQNAVGSFFKKQEANKKRFEEQISERIAIREKLCEEAEALAKSTDWKNTPKAFTKLSVDWKNAGSLPSEQYEKLLQRFKAASDYFFDKRNSHFDNSRKAREEICAKIESFNFDASSEESFAAWKKLEEEWKSLENSGYSKELYERFYAASDHIWEAASKSKPEIAKELDKNWEIKHGLMEQLKSILEQDNFKFRTLQTVRNLQIEWEKAGRCGVAEAEISAKFAELIQKFFSIYNDQKEIRGNLDKINAQKKEDLCKRAEDLLAKAKNKNLTRNEVVSETASLRAAWRDSGNVSMYLAKILWKRFNGACNAACHAFEEVEVV